MDVFVGLLLIYKEYRDDGPYGLKRNEDNYELTDRPYDIVEIILLGIIILENFVKMTFIFKDKIMVIFQKISNGDYLDFKN